LVCPGISPASPATSAYNDVTETMKGGSDRTDVAKQLLVKSRMAT